MLGELKTWFSFEGVFKCCEFLFLIGNSFFPGFLLETLHLNAFAIMPRRQLLRKHPDAVHLRSRFIEPN